MATPRKVASLNRLVAQIDALFPKRSKLSDGWIGDTAHSARKSDHNPDPDGTVDARDITHDPKNGVDIANLVNVLIAGKDRRISYIIANSQIISGNGGPKPWVRRKYSGSNKHTKHIHISVLDKYQDDGTDWNLAGLKLGSAPKPAPVPAPKPAPKPQPAPAPSLTVEQQILLLPESDDLKAAWPQPKGTVMHAFQRVVFAVQSQLKYLKYPPGGLDGKWGPLTKEALLAAQADNGVPATGEVDVVTVKTILGWKEREFVPERENATPEKVEQTQPVAKQNAVTRLLAKLGAWVGFGIPAVGGVGQAIEATGQAKTIMDTVKDYLPSTSAVVVSLVFLAILYFVLRSANKTGEQAAEDVRSGALR